MMCRTNAVPLLFVPFAGEIYRNCMKLSLDPTISQLRGVSNNVRAQE